MGRISRYSRYKFALTITTAVAGSALDGFVKWRSGEKKVTYTQSETSNPGKLLLVYLQPFSADGTDKYEAPFSQRASTNMSTVAGDAGLFCHKTLTTGESPIISLWEPAKAHIHKTGTGDGSNETSKITGKTYKKKAGAAAYTVPFGANSDTEKLLERMSTIKKAVKAKNNSVSFTPERFYDS